MVQGGALRQRSYKPKPSRVEPVELMLHSEVQLRAEAVRSPARRRRGYC
jgi:hypothetical protein